MSLMDDYKEPGGKEKLKGKPKWINDDYVKFCVMDNIYEKNGSGVLAFINPRILDNLLLGECVGIY